MSKAKVGLSKKISAKVVMGQAITNVVVLMNHPQFNKDTSQLDCMSVMGIATGTVTGEGEHGPWVGFTGQFKAVNPHSGKEFMSGKCFLPEVASNLIVGPVMQGTPVEFAFNIIAQLDEQSPVGWSYTAVPLINESHNPLAELEKKLATPLLEAPKQKAAKK